MTLLLAAGLAACGGSDDSGSTTTEASGTTAASDQGDSGSAGGNASDFVPQHHDDSGGGSQQYRVKGGDNSVQEFGVEADASERDAAALALHNFLDARAEGEWVAACEYLSKSAAESLERLATQTKKSGTASCAAGLDELTNPAAEAALKAEAAEVDVGSLRVEGERAFILYSGLHGIVFAMPVASEGGDWKVAGLSATPIS
jgi:hypothetical protein